MARNVFISFLGTNNYLQTRYKWSDGTLSSPVRFIQEAILEKIAKDWTAEDRIFVFYTEGEEGSYKLNWLNNGQTRFNEKDTKDQEIEKVGLEQRLNELNFNAKVEGVAIPEGFSEEDVWEIFNIVYRKLKENDQIFFDITHAFRSIPLFASTLFNFAQYMLGVEVVSVNYGAFEKLGPAYKVKDFPINERVAPIVDMTNIVRLQKLTETATSITEFGRIPKKVSKILLQLTTKSDVIHINSIINGISELDEFIQANRSEGLKSGSYLQKLKRTERPLRKSKGLKLPIRILIEKLYEKIEVFGFDDSESDTNVLAAIKWAERYDMLPQAYTLAREYVLSVLYNKYEFLNPFFNEEDGEIKFREFLSSTLQIKWKKIEKNELYDIFQKYPFQFFSLINDCLIKELRGKSAFPKLADYRNIIDHGKGTAEFASIKKAFEDSFGTCLDILNKYTDYSPFFTGKAHEE